MTLPLCFLDFIVLILMIIIMIILASTFSQQASSLGHFVVTLDMFELQHLA